MTGIPNQRKEKQPVHIGQAPVQAASQSLTWPGAIVTPPAPEPSHAAEAHPWAGTRKQDPFHSSRKFIFRKQTAQIKF